MLGQMREAGCMQLKLMMIAQKGDWGWKKHVLPGNNFALQAKELADQKRKLKRAWLMYLSEMSQLAIFF